MKFMRRKIQPKREARRKNERKHLGIAREKIEKNWFSGQTAFLIAIMALPVINWLIFWLYININSILLAFQNRTGAWTLSNFKEVWISLVEPVDYGGSVQLALKNTLKYFGVNVFVLLPWD